MTRTLKREARKRVYYLIGRTEGMTDANGPIKLVIPRARFTPGHGKILSSTALVNNITLKKERIEVCALPVEALVG